MSAKKPIDPNTYLRLFENTGVDGEAVLEDLMRKFSSVSPYVRGGQEAERESCFLLGQRAVIDHVITQINKAKGL